MCIRDRVVAGAWLSNAPLGVMAGYLLAAVALAAALLQKSWVPVLRAAISAALGVALAAIYLIPAVWEQHWADLQQAAADFGQRIENSWLFARHADPALNFHDFVLHQASLIAVAMIAVALCGLLVCWLRGRLPGQRQWWIPLALIPVVIPVSYTHLFRRADVEQIEMAGFSPRGNANDSTKIPSGAKARACFAASAARLKSCPFNAEPASSGEDLRSLHALLGLSTCEGCTLGSNNWVIAGSHTASGKPMLSNDMHLSLTEPNIWFMADLKAPGFHAAGVTLPGMPFVIAGHNEHVAWGFTALYADVQDLYIEKLDGKGNFEDIDGEWKPLAVDHEVIHVRGSKDVQLDVRSTAHGPLLNPLLTKETRSISLKWTLYDPALNAIPLYEINTASNWTEFSAALSAWNWPTQNVVYSDDQGHIAYHAIGKVPIRGGGVGIPDVPLPHGTNDTRSVWGYIDCAGICPRYIPFDLLPNAFDPPSGFLATANSRVTTDKSPYPLTLEWAGPYRTERIYKMLQGRDQLKPADMLAVQNDVYSEVDQELGHRFAYAIDHTPGRCV